MTFTGCGTALVTPFKADGALDEPTLRQLVRRQVAAGIDFLVPCGTTAESPTLERDEHLRIVEIVLEEAAGKVPVLAGAGGYNTREVIELAREIERLDVDGILSVTPRRTTTSPPRGGSTGTTGPLQRRSNWRSWSTASRGARA